MGLCLLVTPDFDVYLPKLKLLELTGQSCLGRYEARSAK